MTDTPERDTDHIEQLLRLAGPREAVPPERALRVRAAVRDEWRRQTRARAQRIRVGWAIGALATAALVLVGVRLAVRDSAPIDGVGPAIATVETVAGLVGFQIGDQVRAGSSLATGADGRMAVRMVGGAVVRVDRETRLQLVSGSALLLGEGAIYVDSGTSAGLAAIEIRTKLGVARDIGTRFEVRLRGSALRLRVRDGLVQLTQGRATHEAKPGDELTLDDSGRLARRTVPVFGADWAWADTLATPFELEGRSLREFLAWIAGENGWRLRFANAAVEEQAAKETMHGSIEGLTPEEALAAVLPTTSVEYQLEDGVLTIRAGADTTNVVDRPN